MHRPLVMQVGVGLSQALRKQKRWVFLRPGLQLTPMGAVK